VYQEVRDVVGDLDDWVIEAYGDVFADFVRIDATAEKMPNPSGFDGIIITGSPESVRTDAEWLTALTGFVRTAANEALPMLGICFGHQLIAQALGGDVRPRQAGYRVGSVEYHLQPQGLEDGLFHQVPGSFSARTSHEEIVSALPVGAELLACETSGDTAAFRVGKTTWGVQFHPEMSDPILRAVIEAKRSLGKPYTQAITDPPRPGHPEVGRTILGNFLDNVRLDSRASAHITGGETVTLGSPLGRTPFSVP
jgi:GMP synthase (glutamine-hydrolysing)